MTSDVFSPKFLIKLFCAGALTFAIAILLGIQLLSMRIYHDIDPDPSTASRQPSAFYYDKIGASPSTRSPSHIIPIISSLGQFFNQESFDKTQQKFTVLVGHTKTVATADSVIDELNLSGLPAYKAPVTLKSGDKVFRVSMGLFVSKKEAKEAMKVLAQRTSYEGQVVQATDP